VSNPSIVEIYSAANAVEAYAIANALEAAGIKAHVEGELSGGFPIGQALNPRVSVRKEDEARAREVLDQLNAEIDITPDAEELEAEIDRSDHEEVAETADESLTPTAPGRNIVLLSPLLGLAGMACIAIGIFYSIENHRLLNYYSETVEGKFIDSNRYYRWFSRRPIDDPVTGSRGGGVWKEYYWRTYYAYEVNGVVYTIKLDQKNMPARKIMIRYNPEKPSDYYVKEILPPGWCLVIGGVFAALLLFLAYQFR
jgi:hypothetical protein